MRGIALLALILGTLVFAFSAHPRAVAKPEKDGTGPLAMWVDPRASVPVYHSPLQAWRIQHTDVVKRGDFSQADCVFCHEAKRFCNACHGYVGASRIVESQPAE